MVIIPTKVKSNENLLITQDQYINSISSFISMYGRLPYMKQDDIEVIIDDEVRTYKSLKYAKDFFGSTGKCTEYLFEQGILSFKIISDKINISPTKVENLLKGENKDIDKHDRRMLHVFFNEDLYCPKKGKYKKIKCSNENTLGGQPYWVDVIAVGKGRKDPKKYKK